VCGRPPFVSDGFGEMIHFHLNQPPPPARTINPAVPEDLERLIVWCLAKEPAERIQTMTDVHAFLTGRPTPARVTAPTRPQRLQQPGVATPSTTFTEAAQASAARTIPPRPRSSRAPAILAGVLVVGAVGAYLTRGAWMPRPAEPVAVTPAVPPAPPTTPEPP